MSMKPVSACIACNCDRFIFIDALDEQRCRHDMHEIKSVGRQDAASTFGYNRPKIHEGVDDPEMPALRTRNIT